MPALFDTTASALRFALNYSGAMPRPVMNKMTAADPSLKRVEVKVNDEKKVVIRGSRRRFNGVPRGLDGAAQAGMIAKQLDYLPTEQKDCVIAQYKQWVLPCSCKSPCCSGFMRNPGWSEAVDRLCNHLKDQANLTRVHGRKGLSTHPIMRRALVERFFIPGKTIVLSELAERCEVTPQTVITHKKPIEAYLEAQLRLGMISLDQILTTLGIVGPID